MGQAKQRGTYEVRKAGAVERDKKRRMAMAEVARRKPSPKHVALMGMIAAMTQVHNVQIEGAARLLAQLPSNAGLGVSPGEEQDGNV